mmetsp:Transcript_23630/g.72698  ORF Transcript_23630/g.72698 Transcript_23630/m.72698 type:complete len:366 (-) Transcript_23630:27-1124(-)
MRVRIAPSPPSRPRPKQQRNKRQTEGGRERRRDDDEHSMNRRVSVLSSYYVRNLPVAVLLSLGRRRAAGLEAGDDMAGSGADARERGVRTGSEGEVHVARVVPVGVAGVSHPAVDEGQGHARLGFEDVADLVVFGFGFAKLFDDESSDANLVEIDTPQNFNFESFHVQRKERDARRVQRLENVPQRRARDFDEGLIRFDADHHGRRRRRLLRKAHDLRVAVAAGGVDGGDARPRSDHLPEGLGLRLDHDAFPLKAIFEIQRVRRPHAVVAADLYENPVDPFVEANVRQQILREQDFLVARVRARIGGVAALAARRERIFRLCCAFLPPQRRRRLLPQRPAVFRAHAQLREECPRGGSQQQHESCC